ncbi:hypothetical protein CLV47_1188 [Antricoccus suffuscus]|uniref:Uncharacterized protein n=1 Tax=Antricoccus suffuscus TaxID=1629062 RepID=A0A2T0ZTN4_9ACTN|nr:hypothetical protein [Antricoccus suffuscus]PRZ39644.1 hypothetical protein CLV47_1188 [Antricoccus suffuscus]
MQTTTDHRYWCRDDADAQQTLVLLREDRQWLREQFDSIIAAEWPAQPPDPPSTRVAVAPTPGADRVRATTATARAGLPRAHAPGTDGWARPRSPPGRAYRDAHQARHYCYR